MCIRDRLINTAIRNQINGSDLYVAYLYRGDFDSNILRFWTGTNDIDYQGVTYKGNGFLHSISGFSEDAGKVVSESIAVRLAGVPSEIISLALNNAFQSRAGYISIAFLNSSGSIVGARRLFNGTLDTGDINENISSSTVSFVYKDDLARIKTSRELRWTPEEHKSDYPTDLGFDYVPLLESKRVYWGRSDTTRSR